jgi:hypothetical protein
MVWAPVNLKGPLLNGVAPVDEAHGGLGAREALEATHGREVEAEDGVVRVDLGSEVPHQQQPRAAHPMTG